MKAPVLVAVGLAALAAANGHATPSASCTPPALGFGDGEGRNASGMPPTVGALRTAMLFVDFSDSPGTTEPQTLYDAYVPRVVEWYRTVSYGRLDIDVEPLPRWLRLPQTLADYQANRFEGAIEAAVAAADPSVDFASIDALYVVASMPSLASTIVDDVPLRVDGAEIHAWAWLATGSLQRLPFVAIHETGHVLGLPDLYDDRAPSTKHGWDVMTAAPGGGGMFGWHRWKLGWLDPDQVVCLTGRRTVTATLAPVEGQAGAKAVISSVGKAAIVVEVRARVAEDGSICSTGVLVYRVDFAAGSPQAAGSGGLPITMWPARRDDSRQWTRCGRDWRAPLDVGRGRIMQATAWNHTITLLKRLPDGSYRVRVARR